MQQQQQQQQQHQQLLQQQQQLKQQQQKEKEQRVNLEEMRDEIVRHHRQQIDEVMENIKKVFLLPSSAFLVVDLF